jgi:hypothetical protein
LKVEYLGEIAADGENILECQTGAREEMFDEKNQSSKIS